MFFDKGLRYLIFAGSAATIGVCGFLVWSQLFDISVATQPVVRKQAASAATPQPELPQVLSEVTKKPEEAVIYVEPSDTAIVKLSADEVSVFAEQNNIQPGAVLPANGLDGHYVVELSSDQINVEQTSAEVYPRRRYEALLTPNDPLASFWYPNIYGGQDAWDTTTGNTDTILAVIDSGFALNHEDLTGRWAENSGEMGSCGNGCDKSTNGVDDDLNGYIDDHLGWDTAHGDNHPQAGTHFPALSSAKHGTLVMGIAGATGNNGTGSHGVDWKARLLPVQALGDDGAGYTEDVVKAMNYAAFSRGADVISMSLGSNAPDPLLEDAVQAISAANIPIVVAAGNSGSQMVYPAVYPETIAVGSVNSSSVRSAFSSVGPSLDLLAPGEGVIHTTSFSQFSNSAYNVNYIAGTSISTPVVGGIVSLIKGAYPAITNTQVTDILYNTAVEVPGMNGEGFTQEYGWGVVNAGRAMKVLLHAEGSLLVDTDGSYYLIEKGLLRKFPSKNIMKSWRYYPSEANPIFETDKATYPAGPDKKYREGTLLRDVGTSKRYIIENDKKSYINSQEIINLIAPKQPILDVYTSTAASIPNGPDIFLRAPPGSIVTYQGDMYKVGQSNKLHPLQHPIVQHTNFIDGHQVIPLSYSAFISFTIDDTEKIRSGSLLKTGTGNGVYEVQTDANGTQTKHLVATDAIRQNIFRNKQSYQVSTSFLASIPTGAPLSGASTIPDGALVGLDSGTVYFIEDGKRRWVGNPLALFSLGFKFEWVTKHYSEAQILALPQAGTLGIADGLLIQGSPKLYITDNSKKRWITGPDSLVLLQIDEATRIPTTIYPEGLSLPDGAWVHVDPLTGSVIREVDTGKVYHLLGGTKHWVGAPGAFWSNRYTEAEIRNTRSQYTAHIPDSARTVKVRNGTLAVNPGKRVYYMENDEGLVTRHHMEHPLYLSIAYPNMPRFDVIQNEINNSSDGGNFGF